MLKAVHITHTTRNNDWNFWAQKFPGKVSSWAGNINTFKHSCEKINQKFCICTTVGGEKKVCGACFIMRFILFITQKYTRWSLCKYNQIFILTHAETRLIRCLLDSSLSARLDTGQPQQVLTLKPEKNTLTCRRNYWDWVLTVLHNCTDKKKTLSLYK